MNHGEAESVFSQFSQLCEDNILSTCAACMMFLDSLLRGLKH